jgi:hypothetical protein
VRRAAEVGTALSDGVADSSSRATQAVVNEAADGAAERPQQQKRRGAWRQRVNEAEAANDGARTEGARQPAADAGEALAGAVTPSPAASGAASALVTGGPATEEARAWAREWGGDDCASLREPVQRTNTYCGVSTGAAARRHVGSGTAESGPHEGVGTVTVESGLRKPCYDFTLL